MQPVRVTVGLTCVGLLGTLICSCSGRSGPSIPMADVSGMVTLDEIPIPKGEITFIPTDGQTPTAGTSIHDGQFALCVPKGDFRVEISSPEVTGTRKLYDTPDSPTQDIVVEVLPEIYNKKSLLREVIEADHSNLNFNLKKKP